MYKVLIDVSGMDTIGYMALLAQCYSINSKNKTLASNPIGLPIERYLDEAAMKYIHVSYREDAVSGIFITRCAPQAQAVPDTTIIHHSELTFTEIREEDIPW